MELNRQLAKESINHPEKILQFGEGNFLRAFVEWIVNKMNKEIDFNTGVVIAQPIENGLAELINSQDGLYHVQLKGIKDSKPIKENELIDCVTRALNPYSEFDKYLAVIDNPDLRFVISNTTEAGISWDESDKLDQTPQSSFPGKMTSLLYRRFKTFKGDTSKGLIIICCELIDRNADFLKQYVLKHAINWKLEQDFFTWIEEACAFCNTLVDRIVPGFPKDNIDEVHAELGFKDQLVTVGEYFHLWVIEAPQYVKDEFPADKAGLEVKFVDDMTDFREQKVRVLNGAHTGSFAVSLLYGIETVRESIEHDALGRFMNNMVYNEILKTIKGEKEDLNNFAKKILERFYNPYIRHEWKSIALNSMSKWKTRNLCSLLDYIKVTNQVPSHLSFSLAALIAYYKGEYNGKKIEIQDDQVHIDFMKKVWGNFDLNPENVRSLTEKVLAYSDLWEVDLNQTPNLTDTVSKHLFAILSDGIQDAIKTLS
ncbi:tagaturonate reductase [Marinifilum caeruleilacunae]|uniref:Tagaturonate reductase n=1 Tax=Marinifilum caeruleilacunae TaxID=2499076 RepID=A0ABX1WYY9_9BACT|nr:tagaturonate reductase [Marinifilum caeruleilacunae]NOU61312.1 tagaturonate reductase [Marinifilum caeruleilacunae]